MLFSFAYILFKIMFFSDEMDEDYETQAKQFMDLHSPIEANAHLQYHASTLELPKMYELSNLDPKIQK